MSREEAISNLRDMMGGMPFDKCFDWIDACSVAIRSIEAWDKVIDYLDSRIVETKHDMEDDPDNMEWYLGYWEGLHELKTVIGTCMKEVEE